jgi:hypothetical protein
MTWTDWALILIDGVLMLLLCVSVYRSKTR